MSGSCDKVLAAITSGTDNSNISLASNSLASVELYAVDLASQHCSISSTMCLLISAAYSHNDVRHYYDVYHGNNTVV